VRSSHDQPPLKREVCCHLLNYRPPAWFRDRKLRKHIAAARTRNVAFVGRSVRSGPLIFFLPFWSTLHSMTKVLTADIQRKHAEGQLFGARRALSHLVELYDSGQWRNLYREDTFAEAVRAARQAVDHWTGIVAKTKGSDAG
jgi:hypothetical protein